jgi:hypothetical protein
LVSAVHLFALGNTEQNWWGKSKVYKIHKLLSRT